MVTTDISPLLDIERGELVLDTGLTYDGITPVLVHVTKREQRYSISDGGGAVAAAGVNPRRLAFDDHITDGVYSVNVSRKGVVGVPVGPRMASREWIDKVVELVAEGSCTLYDALLET